MVQEIKSDGFIEITSENRNRLENFGVEGKPHGIVDYRVHSRFYDIVGDDPRVNFMFLLFTLFFYGRELDQILLHSLSKITFMFLQPVSPSLHPFFHHLVLIKRTLLKSY